MLESIRLKLICIFVEEECFDLVNGTLSFIDET